MPLDFLSIGEKYSRNEHAEAFTDRKSGSGWTADTTPLRLFQSRVDRLIRNKKITVTPKGPDRLEGRATHPSGIAFDYSLIKVRTEVGEMWGVCLDRARNAIHLHQSRQTGFVQERGDAAVA